MPQGISKIEMEIKTIAKISEAKKYEPVTCSKNKIAMATEGRHPRKKYSHGYNFKLRLIFVKSFLLVMAVA